MKEIIKKFKTAAFNPKFPHDLIDAYLDYLESKTKDANIILYEFGLPQNKELLDAVAKIENCDEWEQVVRKKAKEYLEAFKDKELPHKERRKRIENAIRLLLKGLYEKHNGNIDSASLVLLADAYLKRSQIIRPKGRSIPAKKTEAIRKGIKYANEAIEKCADKDAWRVKAMLYFELERLEKGGDELVQYVLNAALANGCKEFDKSADDVKIAVLFSELNESDRKTYFDVIKKSPLCGMELEKAKMYSMVGDYCGLKGEMERLIKSLNKRHFSDPLWDDTARFLEGLYKKAKDDWWKELSPKVWDACQKREETTCSPLHIRWYWSRMRILYDLAFLAAGDDIEQKVRIADSLKSRPALRWNVIERIPDQLPKGKEEERKQLKDMIEAYACALTGYYLKEAPKVGTAPQKALTFTAVNQDWIVIHFYLNHLEEKGYALIYDGGWEEKSFKYDKLFSTFMTWQTSYARKKMAAAEETVDLCKAIGKAMPFLFELPDNRPVLFIPHDFLHRLPLHGAIKDDGSGEVFLEKHPSCYLPAWSFMRGKDTDTSKKEKPLLLKNFDDYPFDSLKNRFLDRVREPANPLDLKTISSPPTLLVILCHGEADAVNPFNAKLKLTGEGITHLEILKSDINLHGTRVVLGACETDLVPTVSDPLDEHLSISTALLTKGASGIVGAMWSGLAPDLEKIAEKFAEKTNSSYMDDIGSELQGWQNKMLGDYRCYRDSMYFFRTVAFRIVGFSG